MLHDARLREHLPDIGSGYADLSTGLSRVVKKDPVSNDVRFPLREVVPAAESNQGSAIANPRGHQKGEYNGNKEGDKTLDWRRVSARTWE